MKRKSLLAMMLLVIFMLTACQGKDNVSDSFFANFKTFEDSGYQLEKNKEFSFDYIPASEKSVGGIAIGLEYYLSISKNTVAFYHVEEKKLVEFAKGYAEVEEGVALRVICRYDGEYFRLFLQKEGETVEPWQKFEVRIGKLSNQKIRYAEPARYGTQFLNAKLVEYDASQTGSISYQNNIIKDYADPDILYHDGFYYMYVTGPRYPVFRSSDLATWEHIGEALPPSCPWDISLAHQWAPDVEMIDGKFYMAVTFGEAGFGMAVADRPEGPFVCVGDDPILKKTIDGHIFVDDDGKTYLYYTSWYDGRNYGIYGMELEDDHVTPKWETEKLLFIPDRAWERSRNMGGIVEAPFMLKRNGVYYLIYSGSHYQADYAVGYAVSNDPLQGFVKTDDSPILFRTNDVRGPGHCSIVETPTGEMYMVYHVHNSADSVAPRHIAMDRVRFVKTENGERLEVWGPTTSKQIIR